MDRYLKNRCRKKSTVSTVISKKLLFLNFYKLVLSTILTLLLLPALFSCTNELGKEKANAVHDVSTKISLSYDDESSYLDVFSFDNNRFRRLDSYQHWEGFSEKDFTLMSQNGEKTVFVCANGQRSRYDWANVSSYSSLNDIHIVLSKESRNSPCMTGMANVKAGDSDPCQISLRKIASEIVLRSICCDFKDKRYEGEKICDVKVYLTNVNSRCSICADGEILPLEIINAGGLDPGDMDSFDEENLLMHEIDGSIDENTRILNLSMLCYPNNGPEEGPGSPFTRLVIEGKIEGETFWWPININRQGDSDESGIYRNRQYIYDIVIKRKGTCDPEDVIEIEYAKIKMEIRSWEEKKEYDITF